MSRLGQEEIPPSLPRARRQTNASWRAGGQGNLAACVESRAVHSFVESCGAGAPREGGEEEVWSSGELATESADPGDWRWLKEGGTLPPVAWVSAVLQGSRAR